MVYTAAAGLDPRQLLPVSVDVGCNVASVRDQPLYMGLQQVQDASCVLTLLYASCIMPALDAKPLTAEHSYSSYRVKRNDAIIMPS